ncbi:hypothetical protein SESBI_50579 [Sesbania bispinosa]|nr:hypothetical protein SESBI_50579 [Sesbania bispinosa]
MGDRSDLEDQEAYQSEPLEYTRNINTSNNDEVNWVREDIPATIIEKTLHVTEETENEDDFDFDDTLLDFME